MIGQTGVEVAASIDDLFEQIFTPILNVAQVGGGLAPGQVPFERMGKIEAPEACSHERKVMNTQCSSVADNLRFGSWGSAAFASGRSTHNQTTDVAGISNVNYGASGGRCAKVHF